MEQRIQDVQSHQTASLGPLQDQVIRLQADYSRLEKQMQAVQREADDFRCTSLPKLDMGVTAGLMLGFDWCCTNNNGRPYISMGCSDCSSIDFVAS